MGMEYKVKAEFDDKTIQDLATIIKHNKLFDKQTSLNEKVYFEFKKAENTGSMPNFTIVIASDGIYITKYDSSALWQDIEALKSYIDHHVKQYEILDYQE